MSNPNQGPWPPRDPGSVFNPRSGWHEARRRAGMAHGPDLNQRIGDAERSEMAEVLGKHYADGRLDESEFRERLDAAMSAKTRGDLSGLLWDLPRVEQGEAAPPPPPPRHHTRMRTLALLLVGLVLLTSLRFAVLPYHVPWLLIALIVFVALRHRRWHRYGRYGPWMPRAYGPPRWGSPPPPPPPRYSEGDSTPWI